MIPFILMTAFLLCFIWLLFYELSRLDRENKSLRAELEKQKEQKHTNSEKPKEWSEEDGNALKYLHELIGFGYSEKFMDAQTAADMREWVNKSLRPQPHWKPSEYTLSLVKKVANGEMLTHMEQMAMETLCNDLQKLL